MNAYLSHLRRTQDDITALQGKQIELLQQMCALHDQYEAATDDLQKRVIQMNIDGNYQSQIALLESFIEDLQERTRNDLIHERSRATAN